MCGLPPWLQWPVTRKLTPIDAGILLDSIFAFKFVLPHVFKHHNSCHSNTVIFLLQTLCVLFKIERKIITRLHTKNIGLYITLRSHVTRAPLILWNCWNEYESISISNRTTQLTSGPKASGVKASRQQCINDILYKQHVPYIPYSYR